MSLQNKINLSGQWSLTSKSGRFSLPALVPGDTHSALLEAKQIPDPYWARNELKVQHLAQEDWVYTRTISLSAEQLESPSIRFYAESLDTIASVWINGIQVSSSDNMFTPVHVEIRKHLKVGDNQIDIHLDSAEAEAIHRAQALPYPIPFTSAPVQSPHRNLIRKTQCHSGWDWGACLMVSGIYGKIHLEFIKKGHITSLSHTQTINDENSCTIHLICEYESLSDRSISWTAQLADSSHSFHTTVKTGTNSLEGSITLKNPKLWWPNGYGTPHLYELLIEVEEETKQQRIGIRTIETIYEEDSVGLSLNVRVNGTDIFCKGANWIPTDALPSRQTPDTYNDLLDSAVQVHMNMIRVWGGGQYEADTFYDLCDEKGLLVWQDFMFACSTYPASEDFLESVEKEAGYQIKRLRHHACLALWCGNNENVGALNWYEESRNNRDRYLVDYDRLNNGVLANAVQKHDPSRLFWPSSPCGGPDDYSDAFHNDQRGDMHYWKVWHEGASLDAYYDVIPRFCSEFGYQAFPSMEVIKSYANPNDLNVTSPVMEHHQRSPRGNSIITEMFTRYFRLPEGLENFVYLSQVLQGLAIKTAVEHWRHLRPTCMGTLYWQLNDNWPVCSWSSINYGGKWKLLHHMARNFYAPTIISAFQKEGSNSVEIWATNDQTHQLDCTAKITLFDFEGTKLKELPFSTQLPAASAHKITELKIADWTDSPDKTFLELKLETSGGQHSNTHFFERYKRCELATPQLSLSTTETSPGTFEVTAITDKPTFFFTLDAEGISGEFDQNAITLLPTSHHRFTFQSKGITPNKSEFTQALKTYHLRKTYA